MIFHMVLMSEVHSWLDVGWEDYGVSHLPAWRIIKWQLGRPAVAPFSCYLAEAALVAATYMEPDSPIPRETCQKSA